jgi:16S rRNA (cytosine1402-N4)-methyltransferase
MSTESDNKPTIGNSTHGSKAMVHIPVLLHESITALNIKPDGLYADGTLGAGGHTSAIARMLGTQGRLIATDLDQRSIDYARPLLADIPTQTTLVNDSFLRLPEIAQELGLGGFDGILLDLGWNSDQFADPTRGFSFQVDGPLDMRFDTDGGGITAAEIINTWPSEDLIYILRTYADERWARKIVETIISERAKQSIVSTFHLVDIIRSIVPKKLQHTGIHPATKTFQALRIAVNQELEIVERVVPHLAAALNPGGRLCIISFHSGEDRIVKHAYKGLEQSGRFSIVEKRGIIASEDERESNPRSRSARLRILEAH